MNPDDIQNYAPTDFEVVSVSDHTMLASAGDHPIAMGECALIGGELARVVGLAGARRVEVQTLSGRTFEAGTSVSFSGDLVSLPVPTKGVHRLEDMAFGGDVPFAPRTPNFAEIDGSRAPIGTKWELLDAVAPLVSGAANLIIDQTGGAASKALVAAIEAEVSIGVNTETTGDIRVVGGDHFQRIMAHRVGAAWASHLRDEGRKVLFLSNFPRQQADPMASGVAVGQVTTLLGSSLVSTREGSITSVMALSIDPNEPVAEIVETLPLGDFDAKLFVNADGTVDLLKSTSSANIDSAAQAERQRVLSTLSQAVSLREKTAIFGDHDLTDSEREVLDEANQLSVQLI